jgi:hypothetical protein
MLESFNLKMVKLQKNNYSKQLKVHSFINKGEEVLVKPTSMGPALPAAAAGLI